MAESPPFQTVSGRPGLSRVSVIVPLFNKARTVVRALKSVTDQSFQDLEVLIVDDGSTDDGVEKVVSIQDKRFRILRQANRGPGAARNRGAEVARGEYLAFLDADDEWRPDYIENAVALLDIRPDLAWRVTGYQDTLTGRSAEDLWLSRGLSSGEVLVGAETSLEHVLDLLRFILTPATIIRRRVFADRGGFYEGEGGLFGEDTYLWLKLLFSGHPLYVDLKPGFTFHREASDLSRNRSGPRAIEPFLTHASSLFSFCREDLRPLLERVLRARAYKTACMLGFWGDWREARRLMRQYPVRDGWRTPLLIPAVAAGTPLGPLVGAIWRKLAGVPSARAS